MTKTTDIPSKEVTSEENNSSKATDKQLGSKYFQDLMQLNTLRFFEEELQHQITFTR